MLYIITYSTNNCKSFSKEYPNIIVLPKKKKYSYESKNKISSVIDFCNSKKSNDIILYVQPGNFLLFKNYNDIIKRFKSSGKKLIFSKRRSDKSFREKYSQDLLFNSCLKMRINIDFYIGTAEEISSLWKDYLNTTNLSELIYISRLCQFTDQSKINIDKENLIFYNYQILIQGQVR